MNVDERLVESTGMHCIDSEKKWGVESDELK